MENGGLDYLYFTVRAKCWPVLSVVIPDSFTDTLSRNVDDSFSHNFIDCYRSVV